MIEVEGLTKVYDDGFRAIEDVSFRVEAGEIFGFIGPNGAGKTTTIRILATLLDPTEGRALVEGHDVTEEPERVRQLMGYMPDVWGIYPGITVAEYLDFFAAAYRIPRSERTQAVGGAMELTDLGGLADKMVEALSKGVKQRLCLAKTLIHDPKLLILDEPANGLDPRARIELRALLRELSSMGKTILISSHILTELSDLVTSVGIVESGQMVMSGEVGTILARLEDQAAARGGGGGDATARRFTLRTLEGQAERAREQLLALPGVEGAGVISEREVVLSFCGDDAAVAEALRTLVQDGLPVVGLAEARADLESLFMAVTRGEVQ
jgi:ABC-2 type transport system ATP-binding protein